MISSTYFNVVECKRIDGIIIFVLRGRHLCFHSYLCGLVCVHASQWQTRLTIMHDKYLKNVHKYVCLERLLSSIPCNTDANRKKRLKFHWSRHLEHENSMFLWLIISLVPAVIQLTNFIFIPVGAQRHTKKKGRNRATVIVFTFVW